MRRQWSTLLQKRSLCPPDELDLDEPVVVFQRNVFISLEEEIKQDSNYNVVKLLFEEALSNVLAAKYPVPAADAQMLAGLVLRFYEGDFDPESHRAGLLGEKLNELLPYYAIGTNKISQYINSSSHEQNVIKQFEVRNKKPPFLARYPTSGFRYTLFFIGNSVA